MRWKICNYSELTWSDPSPYDIAYSYRKDSPWVSSHQLTLNGRRDDFTRQDLHTVAQACIGHFSKKDADEIIDRVADVVARWDQYAKEGGFFPVLQKEIKKNLRLGI